MSKTTKDLVVTKKSLKIIDKYMKILGDIFESKLSVSDKIYFYEDNIGDLDQSFSFDEPEILWEIIKERMESDDAFDSVEENVWENDIDFIEDELMAL